MISYLNGKILELQNEHVVLDVNGVGYEAQCSQNTLKDLTDQVQAQLFIHTHVREDALVLFGFSSKNEKDLFLSLIKVNGVGPKVALKILSGATVLEFHEMIETEDISRLSKIPKVGKKTAEQLVLALRGKLTAALETVAAPIGVKKQIFSALVNLGFKEYDVQKIVKELPDTISFEEGVRTGLGTLGAAGFGG